MHFLSPPEGSRGATINVERVCSVQALALDKAATIEFNYGGPYSDYWTFQDVESRNFHFNSLVEYLEKQKEPGKGNK